MAKRRKRSKRKRSGSSFWVSLFILLVGFIAGVYLSPNIRVFIPQEIHQLIGIEETPKAKKTVEKRAESISKKKSERKGAEEKDVAKVEEVKRYSLQLAAFRDKESAEGLLDTLETRGYSAYIQTKSSGGGILYLVRTGLWKSEQEADTAAKEFRVDQEMKATVVEAE